jgi:hypothetical protein
MNHIQAQIVDGSCKCESADCIKLNQEEQREQRKCHRPRDLGRNKINSLWVQNIYEITNYDKHDDHCSAVDYASIKVIEASGFHVEESSHVSFKFVS